jgi:hypothetical protein
VITYTLRIAGLIDSGGSEIIWSSNASASPSGTVVGCIAGDITLSGSALRPVDAIASSGGVQVPMVYSPALAPLLRTDLAWPGSGNSPPRLALVVQEADTTIELDTAGLPNGYIWVGGEVMQITGSVGTTYTVTRGIGLTSARPHYWSGSDPAPIVLSRQPTHVGARAIISEWNGSTQTAVYYGAVEGITSAGSTVTVSLTSTLGALRSRPAAPQMVVKNAIPASRLGIDTDTLRLINFEWWRDVALYDYARLWFGDSWVVVAVNAVAGTDFRAAEAGSAILQWGVKGTPYPRTLAPAGLDQTTLSPSDIEPLFSCPADEPSVILQQIATASWPPGQAGGLESSDIGDVSALDQAFGIGILSPPYVASGVTDWWPLPGDGRGSVADSIAVGLCASLGCALTTDRLGRLLVIDWTRVLGEGIVINVEDLRSPATQIQTAPGLRSLTWKYEAGTGTDTVRVNSDYASQVTGGGSTVERSPGWCVEFAPAAFSRLVTVLAIWQYPAPIAPLEVAKSAGLSPGDVVSLTVPTIVGRDGLRGIVAMDGVVLAVTRTLQRLVDSVTVALTGYTATPRLGLWSPSGVVVGVSGDTLTILMDNLESAEDWFTAGTLCQLVSDTGAIIEQITVDTASGNDITFNPITATPVVGDRVVYAAGDVAEEAGSAYWSRGFEYV